MLVFEGGATLTTKAKKLVVSALLAAPKGSTILLEIFTSTKFHVFKFSRFLFSRIVRGSRKSRKFGPRENFPLYGTTYPVSTPEWIIILTARISELAVSMVASRESPILTPTSCAPGATPFLSGQSGK